MTAQRKHQEASAELSKEFALDVMAGLSSAKKFLPFKYLYDEAGSRLFEQICVQPEYYPTRTEADILEECSPRIAELLQGSSGGGVSVIELGSGSSAKTRILLGQMLKRNRICYFPIDISQAILHETATKLMSEFRGMRVVGIPRDYVDGMKQASKMSEEDAALQRKLVLFLGSSIGNFEPGQPAPFLRMLRENMGAGDLLLVGFDLHKGTRILDAAYNDKKGVTARFNLNLLERINRELQGEFDLERFAHSAFYNGELRRVEMYIVSKADQDVYIGALGRSFRFAKGETIHTENSYKYDRSQIRKVAGAGGFALKECFTDRKKWFCLALLSPGQA